MNFFRDHILLVPLVTLCLSIGSKAIHLVRARKFSFTGAFGTGGMPSVHSALVMSLTTAIGLKSGFSSEIFAASLVFSAIIIYDALNVRYEAGLHAKAINRMADTEFNESIGHLPREAFVGSCLGIATAIVLLHLPF